MFKFVMLWKAINNSRQMVGLLKQKNLVKYNFLEIFFPWLSHLSTIEPSLWIACQKWAKLKSKIIYISWDSDSTEMY